MRKVDADALKEDLFIKFGNQLPNGLLDEIDNAPTVEPDILYLCDHKKCGENFNCFECNHTSDIRHAINFDLMEFPHSVFVERARSQGEWEEYACSEERGCSLCGYMDRFYFEHHYCPNRGADMRGGGKND